MTNQSLLAQSLMSRFVPSSVRPLSSKEFWSLTRLAALQTLQGLSAEEIGLQYGVPPGIAERVPPLLDRGRSLALALEELEHRGIWVLVAGDQRYPLRLHERLGDAAPAMLYGVGDPAQLGTEGVGVVGSRDIGLQSAQVASDVAHFAASRRVPVVSGGARGVDRQAMDAAFEVGGNAIGVLAESLIRTAGESSIRRAIAAEQLCLITPYSPTAPFSVGNAMGRNKIIYALTSATVVVRSDEDAGGTWAGATEALAKHYGTVWSWLGAGAGPGNESLVKRGARPLATSDRFDDLLEHPPVHRISARYDNGAVTLF